LHSSSFRRSGYGCANTRQAEWWAAGTTPLLDLQADNDPFRPLRKMNELKDELGDRVSIAVIANAGHALLPEQPRAVVDAIVAWVRRL
jgi:pimeloyl-ACP methyl ester carboxylesterase